MKTFKNLFAVMALFVVLGLSSCTKQDIDNEERLEEKENYLPPVGDGEIDDDDI